MNRFLKEIDDTLFVNIPSQHLFTGTIGAHTRHVIEFYRQFLFSTESNLIDYDERKRNPEIETDKQFAIGQIDQLIKIFEGLQLDEKGLINYCNSGMECTTSIGRELSYLAEHTVHHFALIRLIAESEGYHFMKMPDFGIARSTLVYRTLQNN